MKWLRWLKWFYWDSPSVARLVLSGVDKQSREVIYKRHEEKEPKV